MTRNDTTNLHIALRSHQFLLPYYIKAAEAEDFTLGLDRVFLTFPDWRRSFSFLKGELPLIEDKAIQIKTEGQFLSLIAIDFLRFREVASFLEFAESAIEIISENRDYTLNLFGQWYAVAQAANLQFFSNSARLSEYFSSPATIENWWTKDRLQTPSHENYIQELHNLPLLNQAHSKVLEVGSGYGRNADLLKSSTFSLVSDISFRMLLGRAANENTGISRVVFDVQYPPLQPVESFNLVIMVQVSMHLNDPFKVVSDFISRQLAKGGLMLVDFTCTDLALDWIQKSPFTRLYGAKFVEQQLAKIQSSSVMQTLIWQENLNTFWKAFVIKKG